MFRFINSPLCDIGVIVAVPLLTIYWYWSGGFVAIAHDALQNGHWHSVMTAITGVVLLIIPATVVTVAVRSLRKGGRKR